MADKENQEIKQKMEKLSSDIVESGLKENPEMLSDLVQGLLSSKELETLISALRIRPVIQMNAVFENKIEPFLKKQNRNEDGFGIFTNKNGSMIAHFERYGVKGVAFADMSKHDMAEDKFVAFITDGEEFVIQETSIMTLRSLSFTNKETIYSKFFRKPTNKDWLRAQSVNVKYTQLTSDEKITKFAYNLKDFGFFCDRHQQ